MGGLQQCAPRSLKLDSGQHKITTNVLHVWHKQTNAGCLRVFRLAYCDSSQVSLGCGCSLDRRPTNPHSMPGRRNPKTPRQSAVNAADITFGFLSLRNRDKTILHLVTNGYRLLHLMPRLTSPNQCLNRVGFAVDNNSVRQTDGHRCLHNPGNVRTQSELGTTHFGCKVAPFCVTVRQGTSITASELACSGKSRKCLASTETVCLQSEQP